MGRCGLGELAQWKGGDNLFTREDELPPQESSRCTSSAGDSTERKVQGSSSWPRKTLGRGKESAVTDHLLCGRASAKILSPFILTRPRMAE